MFILDRHEYHNVYGLLVSDNTSCFEWRPEHSFKVIGKVQAAKNTICEITARLWKTATHHWRRQSWKKIWTFQNMGIIKKLLTFWGLLVFPAQFKVQPKMKSVLSHPYDAISCAFWACQLLDTLLALYGKENLLLNIISVYKSLAGLEIHEGE